MSVSEIITLITTICGVLPGVITAIIAIVKLIKNKNWSSIKDIADRAMQTVEAKSKENPNMTSDEKLDMAVGIVKDEVEALTGIKWDDKIVEQVKSYIKVSIDWFNTMQK